jgi:glycoprotein-N-acetylgalactosamine 3-beta-galactosyltransferase
MYQQPGEGNGTRRTFLRVSARQLRSFVASQRGIWTILLLVIFIERSRPLWPTLPTREEFLQSLRYHVENLISQGPPHPHKGAMDSEGRLGYIHDVLYVKNHPRPLDVPSTCTAAPIGKGVEGPNGIEALRKIEVSNATESSRVLCIIYTHSSRQHVLQSIVETYASRCDGFLAASNHTEKALGAVNVLHAGPEAYNNMWQKVRSIWSYVFDHYRDDFDCFHIGGDNMFLIPENLKLACSEVSADRPLYFGGAMHRPPYLKKIYCGGGSGYTLNRPALDLLVLKKLPSCLPHHVGSDEDRIIAHCLLPEIKCQHNVDEQDESRYHPLSPEYHASWKVRDRAPWHPHILKQHHGIPSTLKEGLEGISRTSVSFHLVAPENKKSETTRNRDDDDGMRRIYALLYRLCDKYE